MLDRIKVLALGGLDEEGRDCYIIEINDKIFIVDCGMSLPDRTVPGIDAFLPNFDYVINNKDKVLAYIITHGHDEEMGAIKYFFNKVPAPIYCTREAQGFIIAQAIMYGINPKFDFRIIGPSDDLNIGGVDIRLFQTCHNMVSSFGVCFKTNRGNIVYTSDFIVDFTVKDPGYVFDTHKLAIISEEKTFLLLSESKGALLDGYCAPRHRVTPKIEKLFQQEKRIFVSCFWQNAFRIHEILELVKLYNKKIYFYDRYTRDVMSILVASKSLSIDQKYILAEQDLLRTKESDVVLLMLGHGEEIYEKMYALTFGKNEDKRIVLGKNDIFIVASIPTPTYEIIATRSIDSLYRTGCNVCWLKRKEVPSMHARQNDLKYFLSILKPQYYIPVRGSYTQLLANAKLALSMGIGLNHTNVFVLDNGMEIIFDDKLRPTIVPNEVNKINIAPILVDGKGLSNIGSDIIEERNKLGVDGVVFMSSIYSISQRKIVSSVDVQMRGFVFTKEAEPILKALDKIYIEEMNKAINEGEVNFEKTLNNIKELSKRFIRKENGREPLILANVITIE